MGEAEARSDGVQSSGIEELFAEVLGRLTDDADVAPAPSLSADDAERLYERLARIGWPAADPGVELRAPAAAQRGDGASRLEPQRKLAEGGMGEIWAVWDADVRRTLAMKLALGDASDGRALHRLLEEAQVTGQLEHPGIVPVHELGLDAAGRVFFTMQLVEGRDLGRILPLVREGAEGWTLTRAVGVLVRVCEALAYAHAKGVLHRDLKPSNVMVGRFGEVYVMDWGLAKVRGREDARDLRPDVELEPVRTDRGDRRAEDPETPLRTLDGSVVGTPAYMPPEQARGEVERVDERSDVYSLGAILHHLLAGRTPYADARGPRSPLTTLRAVVAGPPAPLPPDAPAELAAVCEKAMAREPARRYASVDALRADLQAWLDGRVVSAHESGAWAELRKWVRRNRAVAGLAAGLALALVVGTIVSTTQYVLATERGRELERALGPVDTSVMRSLVEDADEDWPLEPARLEEWREWLERARFLRERLPQHRARLELVGAEADPDLAEQVGALEHFFDTARGPVDGVSPAHGLGVARRVELVEDLARRQAEPAAVAARARTVEEIRRSDRYGGLELELPWAFQPLGADPESGLHELADLRTGVAPERDSASGRLVIEEESALVFVLIPAGSFWMGAQTTDPGGPNYLSPSLLAPAFADEGLPSERPPHEIELRRPFLLSKYEMTQAQWLRLTGVNPSVHGPGQGLDLRHPVESVTWKECRRLEEWCSWLLPTEAQWEYAAGGGRSTPWSTGADKETLRGFANLADQSYAAVSEDPSGPWEDWPELDDGFGFHAPVGSFDPNTFGLHDVHGNVFEWCMDTYLGGYAVGEWRPSDGLRQLGEGDEPPPGLDNAVAKGGAYLTKAFRLRSSFRVANERNAYRAKSLGLRPALPVRVRF